MSPPPNGRQSLRDLARPGHVADQIPGRCRWRIVQHGQEHRHTRSMADDGGTGAGVRYVALGDSYTIGTSVTVAERFPDQLVASDRPARPAGGQPRRERVHDGRPDPGRAARPGRPRAGIPDAAHRRQRCRARASRAATYERNVERILDELLVRVPADRIVTIAIPDYTVTPAGADYGDPVAKRGGIVANNATMARLAAARGVAYVDILTFRPCAGRQVAGRRGWAPSVRRAVRPLGRTHPAGGRALARTLRHPAHVSPRRANKWCVHAARYRQKS